MRRLEELGLTRRQPLSRLVITLEDGVVPLPDEYLRLLSYELPEGRELGFRFTMTGTQEEWEGQVTEFIRYEQSTVESALVADPADPRYKLLPIATDAGGNYLYLDVTRNPMCVVDVSYESGAKSRVAGSIGDFIDMLYPIDD